MGLRTYVGSFQMPAATGNQTISGLGFTPKAMIFWTGRATSDGALAHASQSFGVVTSTSSRRSHSYDYLDGVTPSKSSISASATETIRFVEANALTVLASADLVSFNSDGFTLNWTTADGTQRIVCFLAIGGTDLLNAGLSAWRESGGNGTLDSDVHNLPFTPDSFISHGIRGASNAPPYTGNLSVQHQSGWWTSNGPNLQSVSGLYGQTGVTTFFARRYQRTNKQYTLLSATATNGVYKEGDIFVDSTSVFQNSNSYGGGVITAKISLGMKGLRNYIGSFLSPTTTGIQTYSGLGFRPNLVMLQSVVDEAMTTPVSPLEARLSWGIADDANRRFAIWNGIKHGGESSLSKAQSYLDRTKVIKLMTAGGSSPTLIAEADFVDFTNDGFRLNWTTVDPTPRQVLFFGMGPSINTPQNSIMTAGE